MESLSNTFEEKLKDWMTQKVFKMSKPKPMHYAGGKFLQEIYAISPKTGEYIAGCILRGETFTDEEGERLSHEIEEKAMAKKGKGKGGKKGC